MLKPCPICNNDNVILYNKNLEFKSQIICPVCSYRLGGYSTNEALINAWNTYSENKYEQKENNMLYNKVNKLYGIDYNTYACGGIGLVKLVPLGEVRELFYNESEMFKRLSELKSNNCCDRFELFTTNIVKEKYNI